MGIVNVTPDSFSDGGRYFSATAAIEHGRQLVLGLGANDRAATVFLRLHTQFAATA